MRNMLRSKKPVTYQGRTVYQDPKAFAFTHSNICKMWKRQAPRSHKGKIIELHHISGKDPSPLLEIRSGLHDKLTKQLHFFIKESFRRDKAQAQAYDQFRQDYWKNVHKIILEVVKNPHIVNKYLRKPPRSYCLWNIY